MMFSPPDFDEDMLLALDGLWDDDISSSSDLSTPASSSQQQQQLEEKLRFIENGGDVTKEVVNDIETANHDDLDAILAKEMNDLSIQERDYVIQDVHGIVNEVVEDSEFVQQKLNELDTYLSQVKNDGKKEPYNRAMYASPDYVQNDKFRLLFLRSEGYNVSNAAELIIYHFQEKQRLFGSTGTILGRNIRISDLNDIDQKELKKGYFQILPIRDNAGRIVICIPAIEQTTTPNAYINRQRCVWYLSMTSIMEDDDTQKYGIVLLILNVGLHRISFSHFPTLFQETKYSKSIPLKIASVHYCNDDPLLYPFTTLIRFFLGRHVLRGRFRTYYGKHGEYLNELQTSYGIPIHVLPIDQDGILVQRDYHINWIQQRQAQESSTFSSSGSQHHHVGGITMLIPRRFDVLLGRGQPNAESTGNLRAFHIVEMNRERYEKSSKFEKTHIAERIVHLIQKSYGRFLKRNEDGRWVEVSNDEARLKISHCFRRLREIESKANNKKARTDKREG